MHRSYPHGRVKKIGRVLVVAPAQDDKAVTAAYYSGADLQVRWGVSRSLVYKMLRSAGFPPALKLGTSLRYLKSDIHEWEESSSGVA